jgi:ketosteroid isomerase-like protein
MVLPRAAAGQGSAAESLTSRRIAGLLSCGRLNIMQNAIMIGAACGLALAASAAQAAPASDAAQIRALEARYVAAVRAKNLDGIMRGYAPGVRVFDVAPPREYDGIDAYKADWGGFLAGVAGPLTFNLSDLNIETGGGLAYATSIQSWNWTDPNGVSHSLTTRVTDVYRKGGGAWEIVHEHVSVPVDLVSGQGDLASAK